MLAVETSTHERRRFVRTRTMVNRATFEITSPKSHRFQGSLLNVSESGALASCNRSLPIGQHVAVRLDHPVRTDWKNALVVRHGEPPSQFGLEFVGDSPLDIILAATLGIDVLKSLIDISDEERFSHTDD